jgi:hypothetical protein
MNIYDTEMRDFAICDINIVSRRLTFCYLLRLIIFIIEYSDLSNDVLRLAELYKRYLFRVDIDFFPPIAIYYKIGNMTSTSYLQELCVRRYWQINDDAVY